MVRHERYSIFGGKSEVKLLTLCNVEYIIRCRLLRGPVPSMAFSKRLMVGLAQTQLSRNNGGGGGDGDGTNEVHVATRWPSLPSPQFSSLFPVHSLFFPSFLPSFLPAPFCMRRCRRLVLFPVCVKHQVGAGGGKGRVAVVKVVKGRKFGATCKKTRIAPLSDSFAGLE